MKVISLNIWGGRAGHQKLLDFFADNKEVDIFCLQEVWAAPYAHRSELSKYIIDLNEDKALVEAKQEITKILKEHNNFFRPHFLNDYGLIIFVKKHIMILEEGEVFVHLNDRYHIPYDSLGKHARNIQYIKFYSDRKLITVINFHGLWNGEGKTDSEDRLKQSEKIVEFIKRLQAEGSEIIFAGDINLRPETESMKMIVRTGLRNLITEFGIQSTRTSIYTKPEKFADYILVSENVRVNEFKVMSDEVSDHAALYLDFK